LCELSEKNESLKTILDKLVIMYYIIKEDHDR